MEENGTSMWMKWLLQSVGAAEGGFSKRFELEMANWQMGEISCPYMPERPKVEVLTQYYRNSMMTGAMKWFCRMGGKKKFTQQDIDGMK